METQEKNCPKCKSKEVVKRGYIQTRVKGQRTKGFGGYIGVLKVLMP